MILKRDWDALPHLKLVTSIGSSETLAYLLEMCYCRLGVEEDRSEAFRLKTIGAERETSTASTP